MGFIQRHKGNDQIAIQGTCVRNNVKLDIIKFISFKEGNMDVGSLEGTSGEGSWDH